jgi:hypothetical protein
VAASLGYRTASHARLLRLGGPDLITLILDTRLTHTDDGTLHPFWARVLTSFVTTLQQVGWLSIVQFQQPGGHVLQVPTAGVVMATHDDGSVSLSVEGSFGQTVVSAPAESSHSRALKHDFSAVGHQCGDYLAQAGCHRVLLMRRDGFPYAAKVLEGCREALDAKGIGYFEYSRRSLATGGADFDGLLDLSAQPQALHQVLSKKRMVAADPQHGDVVVITNSDGPVVESSYARLSFEGATVGHVAALYVLDLLEWPDPAPATCLDLPFRIYPPTTVHESRTDTLPVVL